jgi:hypothetical protein
MTISAIQYRARKLKIDTTYGLSAAELREIKNYVTRRERIKQNTLKELREEMRAME